MNIRFVFESRNLGYLLDHLELTMEGDYGLSGTFSLLKRCTLFAYSCSSQFPSVHQQSVNEVHVSFIRRMRLKVSKN